MYTLHPNRTYPHCTHAPRIPHIHYHYAHPCPDTPNMTKGQKGQASCQPEPAGFTHWPLLDQQTQSSCWVKQLTFPISPYFTSTVTHLKLFEGSFRVECGGFQTSDRRHFCQTLWILQSQWINQLLGWLTLISNEPSNRQGVLCAKTRTYLEILGYQCQGQAQFSQGHKVMGWTKQIMELWDCLFGNVQISRRTWQN